MDGRRVARLSNVEGFGGTWKGAIEESTAENPAAENLPNWKFHLAADKLDAADLDRWVGPRARPNWLQRLLTPLLGESAPSTAGSELIRRINAEGEIEIARLTIEKLKLEQVHALGSLRDFQLHISRAEAVWAGGKVLAKFDAKFLPRPKYEISAELGGINLALLPGAGKIGERVAGVAFGTLELQTEGVGRDELLAKMAGRGDIHLEKVEFRGWNVSASVAEGAVHAGVSHWSTGQGFFVLKDRTIQLGELRLDDGSELTRVSGTLSFGRDADLAIETTSARAGRNRKAGVLAIGHVLKVSGPLDGPKVSVEKPGARQPAD
jgi:hypothetical protein